MIPNPNPKPPAHWREVPYEVAHGLAWQIPVAAMFVLLLTLLDAVRPHFDAVMRQWLGLP